jgi:hypothetical protein
MTSRCSITILFIAFCVVTLTMGITAPGSCQTPQKIYWTHPGSDLEETAVSMPAGNSQTLRLVAQVPAGQILKAYSIVVTYDSSQLSIESAKGVPDSPFAMTNANTGIAGQVTLNGLDAGGVNGPLAIAVVDVTFRGLMEGTAQLGISVKAFGTSFQAQFLPTAIPLTVTVSTPQ